MIALGAEAAASSLGRGWAALLLSESWGCSEQQFPSEHIWIFKHQVYTRAHLAWLCSLQVARAAALGRNGRKRAKSAVRVGQAPWGTGTGPEAALCENRIPDLTLFSSLREKKNKLKRCGSRKQRCKEELHSNKPLSDNILLLYSPCNSEMSQKPHWNYIKCNAVIYFWLNSRKIFTFHDRTE